MRWSKKDAEIRSNPSSAAELNLKKKSMSFLWAFFSPLPQQTLLPVIEVSHHSPEQNSWDLSTQT